MKILWGDAEDVPLESWVKIMQKYALFLLILVNYSSRIL
jgi:hypothetical protein